VRVRWLRKALENLDEETDYIAAENPTAARLVVRRIRVAVDGLETQPGLGRPGRIPGTRELIVARTPYLVPYRVKDGCIEILRVFHTSRRLPDKW